MTRHAETRNVEVSAEVEFMTVGLPWRRLQERHKLRVKDLGRFELRHMPNVLDQLQLRPRYRLGNMLRLLGILRRVLRAADDERLRLDVLPVIHDSLGGEHLRQ